jgi:hypothetical protein
MTSGDVITILRGVAVDPQLIWVFSNDKTIIDEDPGGQYSVKAIGASMELRMVIDISKKVVTSMETYAFGSLQSTYQASGFVLVGSLYLPSSVTADPDVNDANPPETFAYSNYVVNPSLPGRIFLMPQ